MARPRIGDRRWRVEWCNQLAWNEAGDVDRDRCTMSYRNFPTREEARTFAEQTYPETTKTFGIVEVDELEYVSVDGISEWQRCGRESEIYSGEWETD